MAFLPLDSISDGQQGDHDDSGLRQLATEHLGDRPLPIGDVLRRAVGTQFPFFLAAGALRHAEVVDATQQHRDFGMPAIGESKIATGHAVKHDRSDVARVAHVDGLEVGEVMLPKLPAGGGSKRP